jgi:endonuclease YncB( thermonuclease family)
MKQFPAAICAIACCEDWNGDRATAQWKTLQHVLLADGLATLYEVQRPNLSHSVAIDLRHVQAIAQAQRKNLWNNFNHDDATNP